MIRLRGTALLVALAIAVCVARPARAADATNPDLMLEPPSKKLAFALGGAAVGSLAIGIGLGAAALSRASEQNGDPSNPPLYNADLAARGKEGQTLATAAYVFFGFAAAFAVVDIIIWVEVLRGRRPLNKAEAPVKRGVSVARSGLVEVRW